MSITANRHEEPNIVIEITNKYDKSARDSKDLAPILKQPYVILKKLQKDLDMKIIAQILKLQF